MFIKQYAHIRLYKKRRDLVQSPPKLFLTVLKRVQQITVLKYRSVTPLVKIVYTQTYLEYSKVSEMIALHLCKVMCLLDQFTTICLPCSFSTCNYIIMVSYAAIIFGLNSTQNSIHHYLCQWHGQTVANEGIYYSEESLCLWLKMLPWDLKIRHQKIWKRLSTLKFKRVT